MPITLLLHILNEDAVVGEVEELPETNAPYLKLSNPRLRDGREVTYFLPETSTVLYPWSRIHSVEVMPTEGEEQIVSFIRE